MKKNIILIIFLLLTVFGSVCEADEITSKAQLNEPGRMVGVSQGSVAEIYVENELPNAKIVYFTDNFMGYDAVGSGKIDAFVYDKRQMELAIANGLKGVHLLDETMDETIKIAVGLSSVSGIPDLKDKVNQFIAEKKADGTLDEMFQRWVLDENEIMPEIELPADPMYHLTVGTTGSVPPYSYFMGSDLNGYDIELAYRFAAWLGADLEFKIYDWGGIIPAAAAGKIDCIMSNLETEEELRENFSFSDVLFETQYGIMVRGDAETSISKESKSVENQTLSDSPEDSSRWQDYNGKRIGVLTGSLMMDVADEYFPDSEHLIFNNYPDCITALRAGKIDAYLADEPSLKTIIAEQPDIDYIPHRFSQNNYSFAFRKNDPASKALCDELNAFLAKSWENGTMQELDEIWFGTDEERKVVDMSDLNGENGTIKVVTTSTDMPFSYIKDGKNVGYDIDLVVRFCRDRGYALELGDVDFAGRIPAVQSGKYDFTTDMNVTPEREEQVLFSDPTSYGGIVLAVLADKESVSGSQAFSVLNGKTISMLTGAPFEDLIRSRVESPGEFTYYGNTADMILALKSGKTDAFLQNTVTAQLIISRNPELTIIPEHLRDATLGIAFAKGDPTRDVWQETFDKIPQQTLDDAWKKWTGADESLKILPEQDWPGLNGTVQAAVCDTLEPLSYAGADGQLTGFDIEVILLIAKELDVHVEFTGMEFSAVLPYIESGKALLGAGSIIITPEREEAVDFLPYYPTAFVLIVRAESQQDLKTEKGFWTSIRSSFEKTFIRENRWKLILQGVGNTILITLFSILFGTLLGFLLFMLCRNGNPVANGITNVCLWLVQGMPMVVLLMILFYVIFGSVAIEGIAVAVIGFSLTFGASVFGLLKMGVGAVDKGQYEASSALGYSNLKTFFRIILPQAVPHVMNAYKGEIIGLLKATAIVGYIAVQDLTKMGDIIRSRTYEAFFPLIAVTVIYFLLELILGLLISRVQIQIDPKKRKPEDILKGVRIDSPY